MHDPMTTARRLTAEQLEGQFARIQRWSELELPMCGLVKDHIEAIEEELQASQSREAVLREALQGLYDVTPEACACGNAGCTETLERIERARAALAPAAAQGDA